MLQYDSVDKAYSELVFRTVADGQYKENRTDIATISSFSQGYTLDISEEFPLLSSKEMGGHRWESIVNELLWFISGSSNVRDLDSGIWEKWADGDGFLETAYGRYWRSFPIPSRRDKMTGEEWPDYSDQKEYHTRISGKRPPDTFGFDQLAYVMDQIDENPNSRRHVISSWHPANALVSKLPPCHYTAAFNVQGNDLNVHLTQRSGDVALGVPFNIASYALLCNIVADYAGLDVGTFSHTIVDSHIYCGTGERASWYSNNLEEVKQALWATYNKRSVVLIEEQVGGSNEDNSDHLPGLLKQVTKLGTHKQAEVKLDVPQADSAVEYLDGLTRDCITLEGYEGRDSYEFKVAE